MHGSAGQLPLVLEPPTRQLDRLVNCTTLITLVVFVNKSGQTPIAAVQEDWPPR